MHGYLGIFCFTSTVSYSFGPVLCPGLGMPRNFKTFISRVYFHKFWKVSHDYKHVPNIGDTLGNSYRRHLYWHWDSHSKPLLGLRYYSRNWAVCRLTTIGYIIPTTKNSNSISYLQPGMWEGKYLWQLENCFQVISWPKKCFLGSPIVLSRGLPQGCSISNFGLARIGKPLLILSSINDQHVTTIKSKREKNS